MNKPSFISFKYLSMVNLAELYNEMLKTGEKVCCLSMIGEKNHAIYILHHNFPYERIQFFIVSKRAKLNYGGTPFKYHDMVEYTPYELNQALEDK